MRLPLKHVLWILVPREGEGGSSGISLPARGIVFIGRSVAVAVGTSEGAGCTRGESGACSKMGQLQKQGAWQEGVVPKVQSGCSRPCCLPPSCSLTLTLPLSQEIFSSSGGKASMPQWTNLFSPLVQGLQFPAALVKQ